MSFELLRRLASFLLGLGVLFTVVRQLRKPSGLPGRLILRSMNLGHAGVTRWGLGHVAVAKDCTALDVGCGGGKTVARLAEIATEGKVFGVDYSGESVAAARRLNASAIEAGKVEIQEAGVSSLPFAPSTFDVVTAVETHYYWPDLENDVKGVLRVLKPGGKFLIIAETYRGRRIDWLYRPAMALLRATYLTVDQHGTLLSQGGFSDIQVFEERSRGWLCAIGTRPSAAAPLGIGTSPATRTT